MLNVRVKTKNGGVSMKKKISQRWGSAILAGALLLSILLGCLPALLLATASESSGSEELSVGFSNSYAVLGQELTAEVSGAKSDNITYTWMVDNKTVGSNKSDTVDLKLRYTTKQIRVRIKIRQTASGKKQNVH